MSTTVRLSDHEKYSIILKAAKFIERDNIDAPMAVEDAIGEVVPRAFSRDGQGGYLLLLSNNVVTRLKNRAKEKAEERREKVRKDEQDPPKCLCGCGQPVKPGRRFRQGHDSRLVKMFVKAHFDPDSKDEIPDEAYDFLRSEAGTKLKAKVDEQIKSKKRRLLK